MSSSIKPPAKESYHEKARKSFTSPNFEGKIKSEDHNYDSFDLSPSFLYEVMKNLESLVYLTLGPWLGQSWRSLLSSLASFPLLSFSSSTLQESRKVLITPSSLWPSSLNSFFLPPNAPFLVLLVVLFLFLFFIQKIWRGSLGKRNSKRLQKNPISSQQPFLSTSNLSTEFESSLSDEYNSSSSSSSSITTSIKPSQESSVHLISPNLTSSPSISFSSDPSSLPVQSVHVQSASVQSAPVPSLLSSSPQFIQHESLSTSGFNFISSALELENQGSPDLKDSILELYTKGLLDMRAALEISFTSVQDWYDLHLKLHLWEIWEKGRERKYERKWGRGIRWGGWINQGYWKRNFPVRLTLPPIFLVLPLSVNPSASLSLSLSPSLFFF